MENRNGLVVDVEVTQAKGTAEREAAQAMVKRTIHKPGATLGADKNYDTQDFVANLRQRKVTPHVASKEKGSAIDGRSPRVLNGDLTTIELGEGIPGEWFVVGKALIPQQTDRQGLAQRVRR